MARCLLIGCGCRGRALARELRAAGHAVRGTTRDPAATAAITDVGAEPFIADPDRVATLVPALAHVSVAVILLGSATGSPDALADLHGSRLEMLLSKMLDTTVHGIVYEAAGTVDDELLRAGAASVERVCRDSLIPYALIGEPPEDHDSWLSAARAAVDAVLVPQAKPGGV